MENVTPDSLRLNFFYKNYDQIKHHNFLNENPSEHILYKQLLVVAKTTDTIAINDILFDFFQHFKCYDPIHIISLIKEAGFDEVLFPYDFIDFKKIEKIALSISEAGFIFTFNMLFKYYTFQVENNVFRRLQKNSNEYLDIIKNEDLTKLSLAIENGHRRIEYNPKNKKIDAFAHLIKKIDDLFDKMVIEEGINLDKKQKMSRMLKRSINDVLPMNHITATVFFDTIRVSHNIVGFPKTRREILFAFEPIFREIFEDHENGVLSPEKFENIYEDQYGGYYYKYYLARLKSLIGF